MSDFIICRIDGENVLSRHFARHLKIHHQKDYKEYIQENLQDFEPMGWNLCTICGSPVKGKACAGECIREHYSRTRRGMSKGPMSEETKFKLSEQRKQQYANGNHPWVGRKHSQTTIDKISETQQKRLSDGSAHPFWGKTHADETKKKMSDTRKELHLSEGSNNPMYGKTHTPEAVRKIFTHRKMNKLEKLVADTLNEAGVEYDFQFFIVDGGVCKSYDFKIKGKPLILEVDGDFWHGNPATNYHYKKVGDVNANDRVKEEMAKKRGYSIVRLWESDIKKDPTIVLKFVM